MKIIQILVSPAGTTTIETRGFTGSECREASKYIEVALGKQNEEQLTAEFYQMQQAEQKNTNRQ